MNKKLFYQEEGSGIPLLLIHGFTGSNESFETSIRYLRLSNKIKNTMRKIRLNQEPLGLINSLNSQGQGIQKYILKNLKKIQNKTLIFAGEKDEKYIKYSYEIQKNIEDSKVKIVPNSGHNLILENPIYIAKKTKDFILKE